MSTGWIEYQDDETGETYYFNTFTKHTTWDRPMGLGMTPVAVSKSINPHPVSWECVAGSSWQIVHTDTSEVYYHNLDTDETTWDVPEQVKEYLVGF